MTGKNFFYAAEASTIIGNLLHASKENRSVYIKLLDTMALPATGE